MMLEQRLTWIWALILGFMAKLQSPGHEPLVPHITDPKFIKDCVNIHNELRSQVYPIAGNMRYMTWDDALAKTARAWARKCVFKHNTYLGKKHACHPTFKSIGENLWMGTVTKYVPKHATTAWFNETKYYDLDTNRCSRVCGHFTQVVWATSYKIGCALKMCPNLGRQIAIFVCNYSPAGNMVGRRPYSKAPSCSVCEEGDICEKNQCKNPSRDKILSYPYWNPTWEFPRRISCNVFCQVCVTVRLTGLFLAIIFIFILQRKYPNMQLAN